MAADSDKHPTMQAWIASVGWPGKQAFWFGTVWVRHRAPVHEVEDQLWRDIEGILPSGVPRPQLNKLQPGMILVSYK